MEVAVANIKTLHSGGVWSNEELDAAIAVAEGAPYTETGSSSMHAGDTLHRRRRGALETGRARLNELGLDEDAIRVLAGLVHRNIAREAGLASLNNLTQQILNGIAPTLSSFEESLEHLRSNHSHLTQRIEKLEAYHKETITSLNAKFDEMNKQFLTNMGELAQIIEDAHVAAHKGAILITDDEDRSVSIVSAGEKALRAKTDITSRIAAAAPLSNIDPSVLPIARRRQKF